jgi:NAD(P)-dependent dehydrogenase (short-subunit alcohol dehydrogenase family)
MNLELTDKTALVSGSTKGIGFAIATGLAREGAHRADRRQCQDRKLRRRSLHRGVDGDAAPAVSVRRSGWMAASFKRAFEDGRRERHLGAA